MTTAALVRCVLAAAALTHGTVAVAQAAAKIPEFGRVGWGRDWDAAVTLATTSGKPIALLFSEVPGCSTCTGFGSGPLAHALVVEALETLFVPVAIRNNVPGTEAAVLKRFGEPAWNNPVLRFLDAEGKDVVPRRDGVYQTAPIIERMTAALVGARRPVPVWLGDAADALATSEAATATFAMPCFWHGEVVFGGLAGVIATRAGELDHREVVEVTYLPSRLPLAELVKHAQKQQCAARVFVADAAQLAAARALVGDAARLLPRPAADAPAGDRKYQLLHAPARLVPLTALQQTRVNAAIGNTSSIDVYLSPAQAADLKLITATIATRPSAFDGLTPPADPTLWAAYRAQLAARAAAKSD